VSLSDGSIKKLDTGSVRGTAEPIHTCACSFSVDHEISDIVSYARLGRLGLFIVPEALFFFRSLAVDTSRLAESIMALENQHRRCVTLQFLPTDLNGTKVEFERQSYLQGLRRFIVVGFPWPERSDQ
jgi:hypothetical protein